MKALSFIKEIPHIVTRGGGKTLFKLQKYSPEILLGLGIAGGVTATVLACKGTSKMPDILDDHEERTTELALIENQALRSNDETTLATVSKKKTQAYLKTGVEVAKAYAPAVGFGAASIACILGSYGILHKRNVAVMAAYSVLNDRFLNYRERVKADLGDEADKRYLYGIHEETIEVEEEGKNGKTKKVKKKVQVADPHLLSPYCVCFDEANPNWSTDAAFNKMFLTRQQNWANDKLKAQGHLFLNEVYDSLGVPRTSVGNAVGWIYDPDDPKRDSYVDFGMFNIHNECSRDFANGYEKAVWIDPNVDGSIIWDI